jgi:hypothetical protein
MSYPKNGLAVRRLKNTENPDVQPLGALRTPNGVECGVGVSMDKPEVIFVMQGAKYAVSIISIVALVYIIHDRGMLGGDIHNRGN